MSKKTTDETLGREAVKEYLQQYHTAVGKKRILEERHRVLSSELRAPSTGSAFRLTPPTKPTKTDGSVSVVFPDLRSGGQDRGAAGGNGQGRP